MALKWGFKDVRVYLEGEPAWKKAGHPTESTFDYVRTENIVLIDLRDPQVVEKTGFIPKAVNVPLAKLPEYEDKFPSFRRAPIVLYSDKKEDALKAFKIIREWGYPNVTILGGGIQSWIFQGLDLATGPIAKEITYQRRYQPHEASPQEFMKAVQEGNAVIIDVRMPHEYQKGHFKGAINIPVDDIIAKADQIPKDKPIYLYCATGVRAEMAMHNLKRVCPTCNVKILAAEIECEGNNCTISE